MLCLVGHQVIVIRSDHNTHLMSFNLILTDFISPQLSGCEVTQFAVVAVRRAAQTKAHTVSLLNRWRPLSHGGDRSNKTVLIGRSHGELARFTATQFRRNEVSWDEVRWDEICDMNTSLMCPNIQNCGQWTYKKRNFVNACSYCQQMALTRQWQNVLHDSSLFLYHCQVSI